MIGDFHMRYPSLERQKLVDVLRLIRTLNVGPITFFQLLARFGGPEAAIDALPSLSRRGGRQAPLAVCSKSAAEKEIAAAETFGAKMILYGAPEYPRWLTTISDPPPVVTVVGHPHLWQSKDTVAVVGARNASAAGCQFAQRLARGLGEAGITVVSGLARGIDTFAHRGSLASGTVAVIAGGIDNIYPPENALLYEQIKESGAIISEQPFGALPFSGAFPGRNRIIAGMTLGTVVAEASPRSGSLITARFALENDREVFAVPGSPLDARAKGCNQLIRQGAIIVEGIDDILQGIVRLRSTAFQETDPAEYQSAFADTAAGTENAEGVRALMLEKLSITPVSVDELVEQCKTSASVALAVILELELAGCVRRVSGNKVALVADLNEEVA